MEQSEDSPQPTKRSLDYDAAAISTPKKIKISKTPPGSHQKTTPTRNLCRVTESDDPTIPKYSIVVSVNNIDTRALSEAEIQQQALDLKHIVVARTRNVLDKVRINEMAFNFFGFRLVAERRFFPYFCVVDSIHPHIPNYNCVVTLNDVIIDGKSKTYVDKLLGSLAKAGVAANIVTDTFDDVKEIRRKEKETATVEKKRKRIEKKHEDKKKGIKKALDKAEHPLKKVFNAHASQMDVINKHLK